MPQLPELEHWYDPEHPPLKDVTPGRIQPVVKPSDVPGAVPDIIGYQRIYKNTARSEIPTLQITARASTESDGDLVDQSQDRLASEAKRQLNELQVYYDVRTPEELSSQQDMQPDIELEESSVQLAEELREAVFVMSFDLELLDDSPQADTAYVAAVTAYQRCIPKGHIDGYKAVRRTEAKAQIQATGGSARVRLYRNGSSVGYAQDVVGGGPSAVVKHNAGVMSTYDMAVKALSTGTCYTNCILYWVRG